MSFTHRVSRIGSDDGINALFATPTILPIIIPIIIIIIIMTTIHKKIRLPTPHQLPAHRSILQQHDNDDDKANSFILGVCEGLCVCVCERERGRER
mmetsp:Transcript_14098/g.23927  ORF Transcript_14098/g.23927 Transcript_14098/m.23927 type:complete len:96 (+) Transcript_14098:141-428(+)